VLDGEEATSNVIKILGALFINIERMDARQSIDSHGIHKSLHGSIRQGILRRYSCLEHQLYQLTRATQMIGLDRGRTLAKKTSKRPSSCKACLQTPEMAASSAASA